jgi:hypothetical protein
MEKTAAEAPKPPVGFRQAVWKGIETVNTHPELIAIPVLLDFFLWLGPRLSIVSLGDSVIQSMQGILTAGQVDSSMIDPLRETLKNLNLFSLLSSIPLFPPSLMAGNLPAASPLGNFIVIPLTNWLDFSVVSLALLLGGLVIGSIYWVQAGKIVQEKPWGMRDFLQRWFRTFAISGALAVSFFILVILIFYAVSFVVGVINLFSPAVAGYTLTMFFFLGGGMLFWIVLFFLFSIHGAILCDDGMIQSIGNSIVTSRWLYPLSIWTPILLIAMFYVCNVIWSLASTDTWVGTLGIVGSAYTNSVVATASLLYYIDKRRWISEMRSFLLARRNVQPPIPPTS